jgi:hypothetical protein
VLNNEKTTAYFAFTDKFNYTDTAPNGTCITAITKDRVGQLDHIFYKRNKSEYQFTYEMINKGVAPDEDGPNVQENRTLRDYINSTTLTIGSGKFSYGDMIAPPSPEFNAINDKKYGSDHLLITTEFKVDQKNDEELKLKVSEWNIEAFYNGHPLRPYKWVGFKSLTNDINEEMKNNGVKLSYVPKQFEDQKADINECREDLNKNVLNEKKRWESYELLGMLLKDGLQKTMYAAPGQEGSIYKMLDHYKKNTMQVIKN